jgi:plastocyanin
MQGERRGAWMTRMNRRFFAAAAALGSLAFAGPAVAAPKANTITAIGGMKVKSNAYVQDDQRWDASKYTVKSGATVTLRDKSTEGQPHTLSLIKKVPKTPAQIMGCEVCGPLMEAHKANPETMEVGTELVEAGGEGFDTGGDKAAAGDSIFLPPKGKVTFKVTAKKGTTLNFVCAIHPWMLGEIKVS